MGDIFDDVGSSSASAGGNYLKDGRGRAIIKSLRVENKRRGPCFIGEFKVESSTQTDPNNPPNPVGSTFSVVYPLKDPALPSGPGNAKAVLLAVAGKTEAEVDAKPGAFGELMRRACSAENPCAGMYLDYETRRVTSRKTGKEIIIPVWSTVPRGDGQPNHPKEVAARKAAL